MKEVKNQDLNPKPRGQETKCIPLQYRTILQTILIKFIIMCKKIKIMKEVKIQDLNSTPKGQETRLMPLHYKTIL
jgi:hypothetical protein